MRYIAWTLWCWLQPETILAVIGGYQGTSSGARGLEATPGSIGVGRGQCGAGSKIGVWLGAGVI